ncbi:helix-turn-helix transcriptional regulator [Aggregatimonas sangjinii]|uniref:Helix-turn-helix transcriptional regulator n=1 Tax=Aggregatimonas sangjinii TaxID=2583587 RepID=A0A5B7SPR8_9FLAO|nr:helix-turn-helix transcriptional regulator [Aggregatimonas sangjinii]QCW98970.1 helix-turn-helix transcriptional regulator [Aggregatimonas sangjinii]
MKDINAFFSSKNTVKQVTEADTKKLANYLEAIKAFARTTNKSVYVIDYEKKGFEYVSDNPLFLSGYSTQEVEEMGYEFFFKQVPEKDLDLLLKINTVGFDFYDKLPIQDRKEYTISYDFHLKTEKGKAILIHQKLTPIFLNETGKIWKAICIVSLSSQQKSGNVTIYKNDGSEVFQYDLQGDFWKSLQKVELSDREKEILQHSIQGYSINEIAEQLFISPDTVKFHRKKLFEKLDVANISEAISHATANKLI